MTCHALARWTRLTSAAVLALVGVACSTIAESRLSYYAPRPEGCALQFVQQDMQTMGPGRPWEVVGYVVISEAGIADPFSPEYRRIVRPRACGMGGEAVTILQAATNETAVATGSGTIYGVLRRRQAALPVPTQF